MKAHVQLGALIAALALSSCGSTRGRAEAAPAEGNAAAPARTTQAARAAQAAQERAAKLAQAREELATLLTEHRGGRHGSTIFKRFFTGMVPDPPAQEATAAEVAETAVPTPEQQEAALKLLGEQDTSPQPAAVDTTPTLPNVAELPLGSDDAPKALPGLRIRNLAAPEEALSADAAPAPPTPNAAERYGLRGLMLPDTLPMDINGKLTKPKE